ncbi:MAG: hypothetical protein ACLFP4_02820 [Spirochaetales bacterium]
MKRRLVIFLALIGLAATPLVAQFRADIGLNVPWRLGVRANSTETGLESESLNVLDSVFLVLPEVSLSYTGRVGPVTIGGGFRGFTFIVQSLLYPHLFAEVELGQVVAGLSVGGGVFPFIGLYNSIETGGIFIPDLKAHVKLGETFRLGGGVASVVGVGDGVSTPFLVYLSGIFVIDL